MAEDLEEDLGGTETMDDGEAPPKRSRRRLLMFIAIPILLIVIVAAAAFFTGMLDGLLGGKKKDDAAAEAPAADAAAPAGKPGAPGQPGGTVFYDMPEILVNLSSPGQVRKQNFLKIRVSFELQNALDVPKIEAVMPRIIDNFQVYLRELRVDDLQGSAGMLRLREELLARVNAAVKPTKVNDVLFKEILVQ
ncbi:MAG TPA: flagellar basal body-associated FliL family protein [Magnetospirillaceae bacterium]|jgi:flagellar FliL protein